MSLDYKELGKVKDYMVEHKGRPERSESNGFWKQTKKVSMTSKIEDNREPMQIDSVFAGTP